MQLRLQPGEQAPVGRGRGAKQAMVFCCQRVPWGHCAAAGCAWRGRRVVGRRGHRGWRARASRRVLRVPAADARQPGTALGAALAVINRGPDARMPTRTVRWPQGRQLSATPLRQLRQFPSSCSLSAPSGKVCQSGRALDTMRARPSALPGRSHRWRPPPGSGLGAWRRAHTAKTPARHAHG